MQKPPLSMYTYTVYICTAICSLLCSCLNCEQRVVWREFFSLRAQWRVEPLFGWLGCCHFTVGPNLKNPQKIRLTKFVKLTYWLIDLQQFDKFWIQCMQWPETRAIWICWNHFWMYLFPVGFSHLKPLCTSKQTTSSKCCFLRHTLGTQCRFFFSYSLFTRSFFAWHSADFVFIIYKNFFAIFKMIMLCPVFAEIHLKNQKHVLIF